jgi:lipid II:glycine glycyltransferase (peptidoglycan interpeptide bridge formation enzyme)
MGNNFPGQVRHNVRKQGQKPRQHGTTQNLSREQLIHRIETLREKLEEHPENEKKEKILSEYKQYLEQLKRFD